MSIQRVDQYEEPVPDDLVLLPDAKLLDATAWETVDNATWYLVNGTLCASAHAIEFLSEDDLLDVGIDVLTAEILQVPYGLHRYNATDGFYSA